MGHSVPCNEIISPSAVMVVIPIVSTTRTYTFFNEADPRYPRDVFGGDLQENPCNAAPELKALYCLEVNGYELQGIPKTKMTFWEIIPQPLSLVC